MASEILTIPEERLAEVIAVIRAGLAAPRTIPPGVSRHTQRMLASWCREMERYLRHLEGG